MEEEGDGYKVFSYLNKVAFVYSIGVKNDSEKDLEVKLDLMDSDNVIFGCGTSAIKKLVSAKSTVFFMHV